MIHLWLWSTPLGTKGLLDVMWSWRFIWCSPRPGCQWERFERSCSRWGAWCKLGLGFGALLRVLCEKVKLTFLFARPLLVASRGRASRHHGEVFEDKQGGRATPGPLCRSQGRHREELRRWDEGATLRSCYRLRHRQVPSQGLSSVFTFYSSCKM